MSKLIDGRYLILNEVAQGGMATVYRAHDERLDRIVAVKIMHPHLGSGSEITARFRREARAAAGLSHPNVVSVFDQGMSSDGAYLAMEYIDGSNLRDWIRSDPDGMELGTSFTIIHEVLQALEAAHDAGLVHRDIKPENILISHKGAVKVADFGLARAVSEATASLTGSLLGTISYVAPEVVMSGKTGPASDLYSLGIMWFEMLAGHLPFSSDEPLHIAFQHLHEDLPEITQYRPDVDPAIARLIAQLTARNPLDRIPSATHALHEVEQLIETLNLAVPSPKMLAADAEHRFPAPATSAAGTQPLMRATHAADDFLTTDLGSRTDYISRPVDASHQASEAENAAATEAASLQAATPGKAPGVPRRRRRRVLAVVILLVALLLGGGAGWYFLEGPGSYTTVPAVAGEDDAIAQEILANLGFQVDRVTLHDDAVPAGQVISTDPVADESARKGSEVTLKVSLGILMVTAPSVEGAAVDEALVAYSEAGFSAEPSIDRVFHDSIPADHVVSTSIEPGQEVPHDTGIELVVSDGRKPVELPEIVGSDLQEAIDQLEGLDLSVKVLDEVFSETVPRGNIVSINAPDQVYVGDTVELVPSKGPELFTVPNVHGKRFSEAKAELEALGFQVSRKNVLGGIFSMVRDQSPAAGTAHPRGTVIELTVV